MEYLYHQLKNNNTPSMLNAILKEMNIIIVPLGKAEAILSA
jgi:hypothetical protein